MIRKFFIEISNPKTYSSLSEVSLS